MKKYYLVHEEAIIKIANLEFNEEIIDVKQKEETLFLFDKVKILPKNSVFVDVGSYNGRTSIIIAKKLKEIQRFDIKLVAIEPNHLNVAKILKQVKIHALNIDVIQSVVSNKRGYFLPVPNLSDKGSKDSGLRYKLSEDYVKNCLLGDSLDVLLKGYIGNIRFIKIDVEGYEQYALSGANKIMEIDKPDFYIEIWNNKHAIKRLGKDGENHTEKVIGHLNDYNVIQRYEKNYYFKYKKS
jgi:FkbM family methyltransferase